MAEQAVIVFYQCLKEGEYAFIYGPNVILFFQRGKGYLQLMFREGNGGDALHGKERRMACLNRIKKRKKWRC